MPDGSPYAGRSTASGSSYAGRSRRTGTAPTAAPKKQGGGILGIPGRVLGDLETAAVNSPGGLYLAGKAAAHDSAAVTAKAERAVGLTPTKHGAKAASEPSALLPIAKQTVHGFGQDIHHPLRHPGFTLLDALAVASLGAGSVARGAAVAGKIGEGARASEIADAAMHAPKPGVRVLRAGPVEVTKPASRSALTRSVTRQVDTLRNRFPDAHLPVQSQYARVGREVARQRTHEYRLLTTPFEELKYAGRRIHPNSPRGRALRAVAEGTPLENVIRTATHDLSQAKDKFTRKQLKREIRIALDARKYVNNETLPGGVVVPKLGDPKLQAIYDQAKAASHLEDARMALTGQLPADIAREAIQKPQTHYGVGNRQAQFHVGQETKRKPFSVNKQPVIGNANTIGIPRTPGRLTHALTGSSIHRGGLRHDVPALVAENALESERHAALLRARDFFASHAQDTPEGIKRPVPIRLDEMKNAPFPEPIKVFQDAYKNGGSLDKNQTSLLGMTYEPLRQMIFPNVKEIGFPQVTAADVPAVKGVKWIDERLLGGLNKPRPSALQSPGLKHTAGFVDAVNNATKLSILYLKPAYAVPNMLGNLFLNLTQQGVYAPANLARAARMSRDVGAEDTRLADRLLGEGISSVLGSPDGQGIISRATQAGSAFWSKPVDLPFRRASFFYEARKAGFKGPAATRRLLHDKAHAEDLRTVLDRSVQAIIDYGDLTPVEQDIIRRVIFFYPWLKGSVKYAKTYLSEHPQQAAVLGAVGAQGKAAQEKQLGPVPPFAEGLFKVGQRGATPLVSNPTAAGILGQPADLAAIASAALSGHVPRGREVSSLLTPFFGAGQTALSGYDTFTGRPVQPNLRTFLHALTAGQPIPTLISRLRHDQSQRMFPVSNRDALLQFLLGGIAPRPVDQAKLNSAAVKAYGPRR